MKKLYILRHGKSPSPRQAGVANDFERPLAPEGREDVRMIVGDLLGKGGRPGLILHSPLRRAVETAGEARDRITPRPVTETFEPLSNELSPEELFPKLRERASVVEELMIVGHQPQLGELTAFLLNHTLTLMPAGLIALDVSTDSAATLLWSCNPEDLR